MIGILFIYWIWKGFTNLALEYGKNKWKYFFIGLGSYYGSSIAVGILFGISLIIFKGVDAANGEDFNDAGWNFVFLVFGGLGCYGTYKLLESRAEKQRALIGKDEIENIGVAEEN